MLDEEALGEPGRRQARAAHVGQEVDGARGPHRDADARDGVEALVEHVAPRAELVPHPGCVIVRPAYRGDRSCRNEGGQAGPAVDGEIPGRLHQRRWEKPEAAAPSRHRVPLAAAVEHDGAVQHALPERDAVVRAVVHEPPVDLVAEDPGSRLLGHLGRAVQIGAGQHAAGRVPRRAQDDHLRSRRHQAAKLLVREAEAGALLQPQRHRHGPGPLDRRLVRREAGVGVDDLVPRLADRGDGVKDDRLAAGHAEDVLRLGEQPRSRAPQEGRRRLPQRRGAAGCLVVSLTPLQGGNAGGSDVRRRLEVRVADLHVHDVAARALELVRPRDHGDGALALQDARPARQGLQAGEGPRPAVEPPGRSPRQAEGQPGPERPAGHTAKPCARGARRHSTPLQQTA
mmetsp:Transcript_33732/g.100162  ORF Transcript_33732/g.100162 Transcript_33732/m.100162 type:complete len:399 (+) Transcript_33732:165-1361(+)